MRSRSHRMTSSDPPDDWVDGSWTVDCVCGVNFDDGEEMVNCDECGVWVHTRCSRYVKSEKSFACDKCKSKNSRNDSEETEVAQLLIELPTKTMRMESSYHHQHHHHHHHHHHHLSSEPPPRRPFKLWTDIPMEERVHVQGIPGGDPALFGGLSSVFTPELWKCAGYVPKKFNFQYREFPCWDNNEEVSTRVEQEIENPIDKGANVLFSLSKETVLVSPLATLVGMKGRNEDGNGDRKPSSKEVKKWDGKNLEIRHSQKGVVKERSLLRPFVNHSSKRKKEDFGMSKDRSGKKRARALEKEAKIKNRGVHLSKPAVKPTSDAKEFEFHEDKVPKFIKTDSQIIISANLRNTMSQETVSGENNPEKLENKVAANEHPLEAFNCNMSRLDYSVGAGMKEEKAGYQVLASLETSSKPNVVDPLAVSNDVESVSPKEKGVSMAVDNLDSNGGCLSTTVAIESQKSKPPVGDADVVAPKVEDCRTFEDSDASISQSSLQPNVKVEIVADQNNSIVDLKQSSSLAIEKSDDHKHLVQYTGISADHKSESSKVNDSAVSILQSSDKEQDVERSSEAVSDCLADKLDELSGDLYQPNQEWKGAEGCMAMPESSSEPKHDSRETKDQSTSGEMVLSPPPISNQRKMVVCVGKSPSTSSTIVISKSSTSDHGKPENNQTPNPITKQRVTPSSSSTIKKDHVVRDVVNDGNVHEMPRKFVKERTKSFFTSAAKTLLSSRISHSSVPRHTSSDSKEDPVVYTSSKASSAQNAADALGSSESPGPLQSQSASQGLNKITSSGSLQRDEVLNHSSVQLSSKFNLTPATHPPAPSNSRATLSDEELALLLHQELNSSPRVPRVPRVRQAGSLPQLASPTAASMLKRTSSFGGKDHSSVSRRKVKDAKDGPRSIHELDDEARKTDRVPSSPDQRRQDSVSAVVGSTRKEVNGSLEEVNLVKKNLRSATSVTANSGPSSSTEATGQNSSSVRNSPRNISDDDTGTVGGPAHRTLPGLINEIMSKGQRMTYEELCNAVLPHWNNLRKHNGERYAYSSHFQAVLDCLRNRTEWAQLVDRGPKTNASRKRRKIDSEQLSFESEDKHSKGRTTKEVERKSLESHREEFPKGKRNARKRRRLALQGRGIKDVRKRRKADVLTDDDIDAFSNSSEESMFSEDEFQGGGTCPVETEISASSDETGTL